MLCRSPDVGSRVVSQCMLCMLVCCVQHPMTSVKHTLTDSSRLFSWRGCHGWLWCRGVE
jgi:hypothetical protein